MCNCSKNFDGSESDKANKIAGMGMIIVTVLLIGYIAMYAFKTGKA